MPLILISNDDGITMEGIHRLVDAVSELGTVIVAAPDASTLRRLVGHFLQHNAYAETD